MTDEPQVLLVDNGSLQPASTCNLRRLAALLAARVDRPVSPVSLLHSSGVDPRELNGIPAEILEPALRQRYAGGGRFFILVPLFFGPSAALTAYIPERVCALQTALPGLRVRVAAPLVDPAAREDRRVAAMLADQVRQVLAREHLTAPQVIMVDHGSPQPAVGVLRNRIAGQLAGELGSAVRSVAAASMERRDGAAFDFNEPLLARALAEGQGDVVVSLLFFSPGRHAGPGGDIAEICRTAEAEHPGLRVHLTPLVGEHPGLVDILAERCRAALAGEAS